MVRRIVVVEDEPSQLELLARFLRSLGHDVTACGTAAAALESVRASPADLVLTDLRLGTDSGERVLDEIHRINPEIAVIIMTAYGTIASAVDAVRRGAYDFLEKPLDLARLEISIARALERRQLVEEIRELREPRAELPGVVCASEAMKQVLSVAARAARTDVTVLLRGESGTGKEVLARAVHAGSRRREGAFVAVSIPALSEGVLESELFGHEKGAFTGAERARAGRFEQAEGGTLFLDEIGEIPPPLQVKLLRVLQERTFERVGSNELRRCDLRIIAATNRNLESAVEEGRFREDLYYRFNVLPIYLPPLRQRIEDILPLADSFLEKLARQHGKPVVGFSREARDILLRHEYRGNVRELQNIVERAVVLCRASTIGAGDVTPFLASERAAPETPRALPEAIGDLERRMIRQALARSGGNQSQAARELGVSERILRYKIKKMTG